MPAIDPILSLAFAMHGNRGAHAVLLGSGVSRSAGIPTGWQVVLDLIDRLARTMGEDAGQDPAAWYTAKFGTQPDYCELLDNLARTPEERRGLLHSYFEPSEDEREQGLKRPTKAHRAIAGMAARGYIRVILTTNFDPLMETALRDEGVEPVVISSVDGIAGAPPLSHWRCTVIKLHGDYLDPRIRNTEAELASYEPAMDRLLDRIFDEFGLIISGWSGEWDAALRNALERCPTRRFTALWGEPGTLGPRARTLATLRGMEVVEGRDADHLFGRLQEAIESLAEINERQHPLTPAIAVATAKRWLADPEKNRIRLHDMIMDEVERVCAAATPEHFPTQGSQPTGEELKCRLERYEALTEILRALLVTFVQWGDERSLPLWTKVVERLDGRETVHGGYEVWLDLQRYPTLLLLYAGGVAAAAQGRYDWLRALLVDGQKRENGKGHSIGKRLDAAHHLGKYLTILPEYERHHTAGSDHIYQLMRKHLLTALVNDDAYRQAFDRFEYLFLLWRKTTDSYGFYGCFAWRDECDVDTQVEAELRRDGDRWLPISTGFFTVDAASVLAAKATIDAAITQIGWRWR